MNIEKSNRVMQGVGYGSFGAAVIGLIPAMILTQGRYRIIAASVAGPLAMIGLGVGVAGTARQTSQQKRVVLQQEGELLPPALREECGEPIRVLGSGQYGRVTLWQKGDQQRAVKRVWWDVLNPNIDPHVEHRIGATLGEHPSIPQSHRLELSEQEDMAFIVMDYVQGKTLRSLRFKAVNVRKAALAAQAMGAVDHALENGYVPLDSHTGNLILNPTRDRVHLIDFGLWRSTDILEDGSHGEWLYCSALKNLGKLLTHLAPRNKRTRALMREFSPKKPNSAFVVPEPAQRLTTLRSHVARIRQVLTA